MISSLMLVAQSSGATMRVVLFILVIVAVALIITGVIIAVLTLLRQRRSQVE
jgi:hypothetical protein